MRSSECGSAIREIRARLKHPNPKVQLLSLQLLSDIVCKCGKDAHVQVAQRDGVMVDIKRMAVAPSTDPAVQRKILALIRAWGEAAVDADARAATPLFHETYAALQGQGVSFPDLDSALAPGGTSPVRALAPRSATWERPAARRQPPQDTQGPLGSWVPNTGLRPPLTLLLLCSPQQAPRC